MIRINLLPVPKRRKREALIIQAMVGLATILASAMACYFVGLAKQGEIASINQQIETKQREIEELKAKVGEVEKYKNQAAILEKQLGVIHQLEAGRTGPVRMMDEFTQVLPRKLWIMSFKESNKKVVLEGIADSGPVIADFLDNLKASKFFENPYLTQVQSAEQDGAKVHRFSITMNVKYSL